MGADDEQQRFFVTRTGRVSRAFWPASTRRAVPTSRTAQRRRFLLINGRWWPLFFGILFAHFPYVLTTLAIIGSSLVVAMLGLHFWFLLLIPILVLIAILIVPIIAAARAQALSKEVPSMPQQRYKSFSGIPVPRSLPGTPATKGFLGIPPGRSFPGIPQHAPETPMPTEPPLIRVLETYDLRQIQISSEEDTSSEHHFLEGP